MEECRKLVNDIITPKIHLSSKFPDAHRNQ